MYILIANKHKLLSALCSSASIERVFSNFSYIYSKLRNRLGVSKASKLVFCYKMLHGSHELFKNTVFMTNVI